jgi:hypothetical protein
MREIKFRAWDGERIRYDVTGFEHGVKNEMAGIFLDGDYWSLDQESFTSKVHERHAIAMQYTGLKDCNGLEIYEGDVIDSKYKYKVFWHRDSWKIKANHGTMLGLSAFLALREKAKCPVEIIGNIYENPEVK